MPGIGCLPVTGRHTTKQSFVQPIIDLTEYDLSIPDSAIDHKAIQENSEPITTEEYEAAYKRALKEMFKTVHFCTGNVHFWTCISNE